VGAHRRFAAFLFLLSRSSSSLRLSAEEVKTGEDSALIRNVPFAESDVKARRVYIQTEDKSLRLGWELTVEMSDNWFYTVIDELDGSVLNVNDWVSEAVPSYKVLPFGVEDPSFGNREVVTKTANTDASPLGWHDTGSTKFTDTRGNNVDAYSRASTSGSSRRPDGGANLVFDNAADFTKSPKEYYEAATTQLFHTINRYHDLLYQLGFDEGMFFLFPFFISSR
jgi:extracellular elastinolytic metalloproteinase